ncbi:hypothetical protein [Actinoplanes friuliensis]|nr:hypothetical protein [Actinoplanes friuliensis]
MSDPMYPGMSAPRSRPTVVTVSSYLLYLASAASIIAGVLSLTTVGTTRDVYTELYAGTENSGIESVIVAVSVVGVVINILFAAALAILAIYNNRGKQAARITTWVVGGIFLCCNGFGLLGTAATSGMNLDTGTTSGPSASDIEAELADRLPGWFQPISTTLTVIVVLTLLGAVILLMLPAANEFFRKPAVAWDPLNPYPGMPGQQPPYPGQPYPGQPYPGQSPYPTYPGQPAGYPAYPGSVSGPTTPPAAPPPSGEPTPPPASGPEADPHTGSVQPTDPWSAPSPPPSQTPPSPPSEEDKPGPPPANPS